MSGEGTISKKILKDHPDWGLESFISSSEEGKMFMKKFGFTFGPAIIVNNKLFSIGDFNAKELINTIK